MTRFAASGGAPTAESAAARPGRTGLTGSAGLRVAEATSLTPAPPELLRHAARLATSHLSSLADRALARIRAEVPHYGTLIDGSRDFESAIYTTVEVAVWSLADPDRSTDSARHAWDIGRRHARAGIPLPVVSQGFRIGAAVVWDRLVELISAEHPDLMPVLARCANEYWQFCERDQRLMMESYRLIVDGDVAHIERKLLPVLRMLLRGHADSVDCESAAVALDVPHDGRYVVARISDRRNDFSVNDGFGVDDGPIRDEVGEMTIFRCRQRHGMTLVVHLGDRSHDEAKAALAKRFPNTAVGMSPVVCGLSALGQANQHADLAERIGAGHTGMTVLSDRIPEALLLARPDLASVHLSEVLGPVLDLDATERDTLLHTMQTLDVGGSTAQAAKALFCHNNTVLNRLRRFERLTGRHLESPGDLVDVALALCAFRLRG
ncbi:helix-turn-helix domain-containing protein [Gordonia sp. VNQ95]|jgi:hypothetical protein|uniref:PucR family transcriptional regulator n=1 Tax=Gordonia sp. VNQ95 TaxID=3156619 RepID=UPI0032B48109